MGLLYGLIRLIGAIVGLFPHRTIVVDTETTGLNRSGNDEILQLSIISGSGRVLFSKYFRPRYHSDWEGASRINHITPAVVRYCNSIDFYLPLINGYFKKAKRIVGYNVEGFDIPILEQSGVIINGDAYDVMLEDAEKRGSRSRWRKLAQTARSYGYFFIPHDALGDCFATLHIYAFMHPGIQTVFYILRKLAEIAVGAVLTYFSFRLTEYSILSTTGVMLAIPGFIFLAFWTYTYGPVISLLSTLAGLYFAGMKGGLLVSISALALIQGIMFAVGKRPGTIIKRIIIQILILLASSLLTFLVMNIILNGEMTIGNGEIGMMGMEVFFIQLYAIPLQVLFSMLIRKIL